MNRLVSILIWSAVAIVGGFAFAAIALNRGESVSAVWLVTAALAVYFLAYRYYSMYIAARVLEIDPRRVTPAVRHNDGMDYVPTNKWVLYGHHFAAIAGAGPLVGPVLAAQMGYLPGTLWILVGVVLAGAVQDMIVLFISVRRDGRSLGEMVKMELGNVPGTLALVGVLAIMIIILAVLSLVVVKALAESPWGTFTIAATIPIALAMGVYMRFIRPGRVGEASAFGVVLLLSSIWLGRAVAEHASWGPAFTLGGTEIAWAIIIYGAVASSLPVWLMLAPRDYLSTFLKIGTIVALAIGIYVVAPRLSMPDVTRFIDGTGPVFSGSLFPFLFITIACGAVSGFHSLISSGTTPKMIESEGHIRMIGYGGMLMESFVAIMALTAACVLDPGIYFVMNSPAAIIGTTADKAAQVVSSWGFVITPEVISQTAKDIGETTILSRAGGAPTLAVGMAQILAQALGGKSMEAFWYHFAILFEALFILTAVDAGTRVGRFMIQDMLGHVWAPLGNTEFLPANLLCTGLCVVALGLLPLPGRRRPARRHQHAVAAVRHRQPDARRDRAAAVHGRADEDEARALRLGDAGADRVAPRHDAHRRLAEDLPSDTGHRLHRPGAPVRRGGGERDADRPGEEHRGDAARRVQQLPRRSGLRVLRHPRRRDVRLRAVDLAAGAAGYAADGERDAARGRRCLCLSRPAL